MARSRSPPWYLRPMRRPNHTFTAHDLAGTIYGALPELHGFLFRADTGLRLGPEDAVYVTFANVPRGSSELEAINSKKQAMISITAPTWPRNAEVPGRVTAKQFRGRGLKYRTKTGTPKQIVASIVDFFHKNRPY